MLFGVRALSVSLSGYYSSLGCTLFLVYFFLKFGQWVWEWLKTWTQCVCNFVLCQPTKVLRLELWLHMWLTRQCLLTVYLCRTWWIWYWLACICLLCLFGLRIVNRQVCGLKIWTLLDGTIFVLALHLSTICGHTCHCIQTKQNQLLFIIQVVFFFNGYDCT